MSSRSRWWSARSRSWTCACSGSLRPSVRSPSSQGAVLPLTWASFVLAVLAGSLLFISQATAYFASTTFRIKMIIIVLAGINMLIFEFITLRGVREWDTQADPAAAGAARGRDIARLLGPGRRLRPLDRLHRDEVSAVGRSIGRRREAEQLHAVLHHVAGRKVQRFDGSVGRRRDPVFELHAFEQHQHLPALDLGCRPTPARRARVRAPARPGARDRLGAPAPGQRIEAAQTARCWSSSTTSISAPCRRTLARVGTESSSNTSSLSCRDDARHLGGALVVQGQLEAGACEHESRGAAPARHPTNRARIAVSPARRQPSCRLQGERASRAPEAGGRIGARLRVQQGEARGRHRGERCRRQAVSSAPPDGAR